MKSSASESCPDFMPPINNNFNVLVSERPFHPFTQRAAFFLHTTNLRPLAQCVFVYSKVGSG